jgi:hypothetical protein
MTNLNIDLTPILTAIIALIGAIITYYIIPLLKGKISADKWNELVKWVVIVVKAAEQMKKAGIITVPKKDFVIAFLKDKGVTITDQELDALIEAAVFEINKAKNLLEKDLTLQEEVVKSE